MRDMFSFLFSLKGNDKGCIWTEPLWAIPFNLYMQFMTLFMFALGVNDVQIGIILAVGLAFQSIFSILGGVLTDKYGRRLMTFIGDTVSWSIPLIIWTFSQNFWWFLVGAVIHAARNITVISWYALWSDDKTDDDKPATQKIINWLYIIAQITIFFAPITGFFISRDGVGLIPVMRFIFAGSFVVMTVKFILTWFMTAETERGLQRMRETRDTSLFRLLSGYKRVFRQVWLSPGILRVTVLRALITITQLVTSTFFALYATQNLGIAASFIAYFPILRATIMLLFLFFIQNRLNKFKSRYAMFGGLMAYIVSQVLLITSPPQNLTWLFVYIIVEACAVAVFMPRIDTQMIHVVRPRERARTFGVFDSVTFAFAIPFGYLAGFLSDINRRLPFVLNIVLFAVMAYFVLFKREKVRVRK